MNIHQHQQLIQLGVGLNPLLHLHRMSVVGNTFDFIQAAHVAIDAGADVFSFILTEQNAGISLPLLKQLILLNRVPVQVIVAPVAPIFEWFADDLPASVCFAQIVDEAAYPISVVSECVQNTLRETLLRLQVAGVRVSMLLPEDQEDFSMFGMSEIDAVALGRVQSRGAEQRKLDVVKLSLTARCAVGAGFVVESFGSLAPFDIEAIAIVPDIATIFVDQILFVSAFANGWEKAVRDMKARIVRSRVQFR